MLLSCPRVAHCQLASISRVFLVRTMEHNGSGEVRTRRWHRRFCGRDDWTRPAAHAAESFTTGGPRDMIGAVVGLLTLLSALTMGLLIWTAYGVYTGQNIAIQTLAAKFLQFDLALADYGPEAKDLRVQLRDGLGKTIDAVWAPIRAPQISPPTTSPRQCAICVRGNGPWMRFNLRPTRRHRRWRRQEPPARPSASHACRCLSRSQVLSLTR